MQDNLPWWGLRLLAPRLDLWSIVQALGGPEPAAAASAAAWVAAGLPIAQVGALRVPRPSGRWLCASDPAWPPALQGLPFAPVALEVEGELSLLQAGAVAVVGARACTAAGTTWARRVAGELAGAGVVVVSGLARGIDAAAHRGAAGCTVAVLGQGLGRSMPAWQAELRAGILRSGGLVLSEFDSDAPGATWTFPVRNRVIAGLSRGVVVVEAAHRSGARNTAAHALRAGREVWAIPAGPDAVASAGCLDLIEEGAHVFRSTDALLRELGLGDVWTRLLAQPRSLEELARARGCSVAEALDQLGALELGGRVARLPGHRYTLRHAGPG